MVLSMTGLGLDYPLTQNDKGNNIKDSYSTYQLISAIFSSPPSSTMPRETLTPLIIAPLGVCRG